MKRIQGTFAISMILTFCSSFHLSAQIERYEDEWKSGYIENGQKVKFWDYLEGDGNLALKFNHSSNRLIYMKPDTSLYTIWKDSAWVEQSLMVYPKWVGSMNLFYRHMAMTIKYPKEARLKKKKGTVLISFEVDQKGQMGQFEIVQDFGYGCAEEVITNLKTIGSFWIPATLENQAYVSRFILPVIFQLGKRKTIKPIAPKVPGRLLGEIIVVGYGG